MNDVAKQNNPAVDAILAKHNRDRKILRAHLELLDGMTPVRAASKCSMTVAKFNSATHLQRSQITRMFSGTITPPKHNIENLSAIRKHNHYWKLMLSQLASVQDQNTNALLEAEQTKDADAIEVAA